MNNLWVLIAVSTLRMGGALILTTTGAIYSTRVGVSDIACEGVMIGGAFFGAVGAYYAQNPWIGLLCGLCAGVIFALLHGVLHITYRVNASISGVCVNLLSAALAPLLLKLIWGNESMSPMVPAFSSINLPVLNKLGILGMMLNAQNIMLYIALAIVFLSWVFIFRTKIGLRMRMVGENPVAAATVGINTVRFKYFGVAMCGVFAGLGGAYLSLGQLNLFVVGMTAGKGYIAMVINAFSGYNPLGGVLGSLFFSFFESLRSSIQSTAISPYFLEMLPYVMTLIVIVFTTKYSRRPAGMGKHYDG